MGRDVGSDHNLVVRHAESFEARNITWLARAKLQDSIPNGLVLGIRSRRGPGLLVCSKHLFTLLVQQQAFCC